MNTERTMRNNEAQMTFELEPYEDGFKIRTDYGHICRKESDPGIVNCEDQANRYSAWNITSRGDKFVIHTGYYCLKQMGPDEKGAKNGNFWNFLSGSECNPREVESKEYFWSLEDLQQKSISELRQEEALREDESSSSSSTRKNKTSSSSSIDKNCQKSTIPVFLRNAHFYEGILNQYREPC